MSTQPGETERDSNPHEQMTGHLQKLIDDTGYMTRGEWADNCLEFYPARWDRLPALVHGGQSMLRFVAERRGRLRLKLMLFPGPEHVRAALMVAVLNYPQAFKHANLRQGFLYSRTLLNKQELDNLPADALPSHLDDAWQRFLHRDFPAILDIVMNEIPWTQLKAQIDTPKADSQ